MVLLATPFRTRTRVAQRPITPRRLARQRRRAAKANAAVARDIFMDVVVLLSVLVFLALVAGIGVLALQPTYLHWPN